MALEYHYLKDAGDGEWYTVTERLARTEDDQLVPEGDPRARWLYAIPGEQIRRADAERYGLITEAQPEPDEVPEETKEPVRRKPGRPPGSKNRRPEEDK